MSEDRQAKLNADMQAKFKVEFKTAVGGLLSSLRQKAGLTLEDVGKALAKARLEKVRQLEAGEEAIHGSDLMELVGLYGANMIEVTATIQEIGANARTKYPWSSSPPPGAPAKTEPPMSQEPAPNAP